MVKRGRRRTEEVVLSHLHIRNIALIDDLKLDFGPGLNLLTGETGSGKSIIVDSLAALTGERVSTELIKSGEGSGRIEGAFEIREADAVFALLRDGGIEIPDAEVLIRRDLSRDGKNRIFVNDQLVTQAFLKRLGPLLADVHGQGEHQALYDVSAHIEMLDDFAGVEEESSAVERAFEEWSRVSQELAALRSDESEKLQLVDILSFQVDEIRKAGLTTGEDAELELEKKRLANAERLAEVSGEAYSLLYDNEDSALAMLDRGSRLVSELAEYENTFNDFQEGLAAARAIIEELSICARDLRSKLDFSPERLNQIEGRLAEISKLKRKYGGSIDTIIEHMNVAERRLENIETAGERENELQKEAALRQSEYLSAAEKLSAARNKAGKAFARGVEAALKDVALERAKFEVRIESGCAASPKGIDRVEFLFSANDGEPIRPLARVASGGEASRLMLILKTVSRPHEGGKTAVFDEVDVGIGGRVAEAVGRKLKSLSKVSQVFCVTHQPQIASLADRHILVEKNIEKGRTSISVRDLPPEERVEEIARMLAGEAITDAARANARVMLAAAG